MKRKSILVVILLFIIICVCACTNQPKETSQPSSKDQELYTVSDNISLRSGTSFDGEIVLESANFIGFNYQFNESLQEYVFTFKLTDEGQKKMTDSTAKLAETFSDLSLWIGDELIVSPKVSEPVIGDSFNVNIGDLSEDSILDFVDKLEGKQL